MPTRRLRTGRSGRDIFLWARSETELTSIFNLCPGRVDEGDLELVIRIAQHFTRTGEFPKNREKFKKLQNERELHEIKGGQLRLIGGFHGPHFYIVECDIKKQDNLPPEIVKKARAKFTECKEELGNGI